MNKLADKLCTRALNKNHTRYHSNDPAVGMSSQLMATQTPKRRASLDASTPVKRLKFLQVRLRATVSPRMMAQMRSFKLHTNTEGRRLHSNPVPEPHMMEQMTGNFRLQGSPKRKNYQPK